MVKYVCCVIEMQQEASDYDDFDVSVATSTKTSGAYHSRSRASAQQDLSDALKCVKMQ